MLKLTNLRIILGISIIEIFLISGCKDEINSINQDNNLLYSANELICDYRDSGSFHYPPPNDTEIYQAYRKLISLKISDRTFEKVIIAGSIDSFYTHDTLHGYNISLHLDLKKDTGIYYPQPGDTDIYIAPMLMNIKNFDDTLYVKYPSNEAYYILFTMQVVNPARGDFIRVKNLKIYKIY